MSAAIAPEPIDAVATTTPATRVFKFFIKITSQKTAATRSMGFKDRGHFMLSKRFGKQRVSWRLCAFLQNESRRKLIAFGARRDEARHSGRAIFPLPLRNN
jgi:hypothetical protein